MYRQNVFRGVSYYMDLFGHEVKTWCYILNITGCASGRKGESGQFFLSFSQFIFHRSTLFECVSFNSPWHSRQRSTDSDFYPYLKNLRSAIFAIMLNKKKEVINRARKNKQTNPERKNYCTWWNGTLTDTAKFTIEVMRYGSSSERFHYSWLSYSVRKKWP